MKQWSTLEKRAFEFVHEVFDYSKGEIDFIPNGLRETYQALARAVTKRTFDDKQGEAWSHRVTETPCERPDDYLVKLTSGDRRDPSWGVMVQCPVCGCTYVHFGDPELRESDGYSAWFGRGNAIYIPMNCEDGHSWVARLGFHKGESFFDIVDCKNVVYKLIEEE